jgi:pyruvate formate lyase activating enzyme
VRLKKEIQLKIAGLQKLTLLDFPERVACTVFTAGCNFRCPFCHNAELVLGHIGEEFMTEEEFFEFLSKRQGILDGVAITGGEPLLQPGIDSFLERIKELGFQTKLDHNGSRPEILRDLIDRKLVDYVAVDIKNSKEKYPLTAGCSWAFLKNVEETVELLKEGRVPYEFRTTVVKELHEKEDFESIGEWIKGADKYFLQQFEDSGELIEEGWSAASKEEMQEFLETVKPYVKSVALRGVR